MPTFNCGGITPCATTSPRASRAGTGRSAIRRWPTRVTTASITVTWWRTGSTCCRNSTSIPPLSLIPSYIDHEYSDYTKRYYRGPSGELLDAFVFANFDAGVVPVKVKAGRHTVFWGESLFLGGALNSISYAQRSEEHTSELQSPLKLVC